MAISRREFVRHGAAVTAGFVGLGRYLAAQARAGGPPSTDLQPYLNEVEGFGPLVPDPKQLLDLPKGFSYKVLSHTGDRMDDGFRVPAMPDGMAAFPGPNGRVILIRNPIDADHLLPEAVAAVVRLLLPGSAGTWVRHGPFPRT